MDPAIDHGTSTLRAEPSNSSEHSSSSASTFIPSPLRSIHRRPGYQRIASAQEEDTTYRGAGVAHENENAEDSVHGLRINFPDHEELQPTFGATVTSTPSPNLSGPADLLLSPNSARHSRNGNRTRGDSTSDDRDDASNRRSSPSSIDRSFTAGTEDEGLYTKARSSTLRSYESPGNNGAPTCRTRRNFHHGRGNWLSITILCLSVYSTIFSGIWLGLACAKPRYGRYITDGGNLPPSTASLLCAAFAKTIELSFVTVFVTFLGQVLSQRAFVKNSKGISIAEMQMRTWVMQPGTMITHWETVRHAALTILGAVALGTTFMAMFYTTASDALVAPKLKFGNTEERLLYGKVTARFANETYIAQSCKTPMSNATDPLYYGQTCMAIEHSGQSYHNYAQYLTNWSEEIDKKNGSSNQFRRPNPVGMLFDNTTIEGSWIDVQDMSENSKIYGRIVNNVSMAMPLSAVFSAVRDDRNGILQPQDLNGLGEYYVQASVPSPAINVLCAAMTADELSPMVLTKWPGYNGTAPNATNWPLGYQIPAPPSWLNKTAVDDIFGFGEPYGRRHPVFPKLPQVYNTVLNETGWPVVTDSIYVLAASPSSDYMLCSLRASMNPDCSTEYHASMSGGSMTANCYSDNQLAYGKSQPAATSGVYNSDWVSVATQWAITMSLAAGISDDVASNARLLTQLIPTQAVLDPGLPSIAEALAVQAGCTLLVSGFDSPLIHYWNYSDPSTLAVPQYQAFNATVRSQDYSSGGTQHWQGLFYVTLTLVFFTNLFCLAYFAFHHGLVTDFIEPQNLFALSLNSPPSRVLDGSCGGGPEKEQLRTTWHIQLEHKRDHFYIESTNDPPSMKARKRTSSRATWEVELENSPVAEMFDKLSTKRTSLL